MKRYLLLLVLLTGLLLTSQAQIGQDDPFKKMDEQYNARLDRMNRQYEANLKRMQEEYDTRLKKMNTAFQNYLKRGFTEVEQTQEKEKPVEVPKPVVQPKYEPITIPETDEPEPAEALTPEAQPAPVKPRVVIAEAEAFSIAPIFQIPEGSQNYQTELTVDFFGTAAPLTIDRRMKDLSLDGVSPKAFASYWSDFTSTYYQVYIESVVNYARQKNLNDWGIYQLMDQTARQIFTSANNRNMWVWAVMNQAGYQTKIGYMGGSVYLLIPFMQEVYEKPYYSMDGSNFYLMSGKEGIKKLMTYTENFGGATRKLDLHLPYALQFNDPANAVMRETRLPGESEPLQLKMDKTVMAFLASYPQTVNTVYLEGAMSSTVKESLYEYLKPRLDGKSEAQSVTYLLNYLHHSFEYKTDRDQFNREKMFFADEIFYYPYSDCEDRTVLFTRLVNELAGLDAVALTYFSHMAAAVAFSEPVEGYSLWVDGRRYTITDPTYINAPIGAVMPDYEGYAPLAIKINNDSRLNNIWQMIAQSVEQDNEGRLFIGDRSIAENGQYVLTGWFNDEITIGNHHYTASGGTRDLWFASFDQGGNMKWFLPVSCSDQAFSQAFNLGKKGDVYALINYTGSVRIHQRELVRSEKPAHLILGISNQAQPFLNENVIFDVAEGEKLAFYGKYRADGTKVDFVSFPTGEIRFEPEITVDSKDEVVVRGVVGEIAGLTKDVPINLAAASFSAESQIESNMKAYQNMNLNRHMVALFGTLELLAQNGGRISGITVRNLMNKHNPDFYKKNPELYTSLLSMQFVVNDGGVVKIETYKGRNVSIFSMKIKNNSNLQIVKPSDHTYLVKCLNGVQVGKAVIWYDLNAITLNGNGNLEFDYDTDHTRRTVSIQEIVEE